MVEKKEVLQYIQTLSAEKIITKEELIGAFNLGNKSKQSIALPKKFGIEEILYYIGGAIVFLGIVILIIQNWSSLGFATKTLVTLGSGIAAYFAGLFLSHDKRTKSAAPAFYLISALVIPIGLFIIFNNAGFDIKSFGILSLIAAIMFIIFLLSSIVFQKNVFTLFSILFGTWLFFSFTNWITDISSYPDELNFYLYRILVVGVAYILIGCNFSKNYHAPLAGFFYGFGIFGILCAVFILGDSNIFWDIVYPIIVFGAIFASVYIKSKAFLTWGAIFLMAYIIKITTEYFSTGLGWPLALVIAGLAMIGVGCMSFSIKKKYLSSK